MSVEKNEEVLDRGVLGMVKRVREEGCRSTRDRLKDLDCERPGRSNGLERGSEVREKSRGSGWSRRGRGGMRRLGGHREEL